MFVSLAVLDKVLFGPTHGTEMDPLDICLLATTYICSAAEVGSFLTTTADRRTSYFRTVVVCSLEISREKQLQIHQKLPVLL